MADIFIRYASEDRGRVIPIVKALEEQGWSTFWDWKSIPVAKTWREFIEEGLEDARCILVLWSTISITKRKRWVVEEAEYGVAKEKYIPVLIDDVRPPFGFGQIQAAKLINWAGDIKNAEFKKLADGLESILGKSPRHIREIEKIAEEERKRKLEEEQKKAKDELQPFEKENRRMAKKVQRVKENLEIILDPSKTIKRRKEDIDKMAADRIEEVKQKFKKNGPHER